MLFRSDRAVNNFTDLGGRTLQRVPHEIAVLAHIRHVRRAQRSRVMWLPTTGRIEVRRVEGDPHHTIDFVDRDHRCIELTHERIVDAAARALRREGYQGVGVAEVMGDAPAVVVAINGSVTAGETPEQAVTLAWYLEDAARVELAALAAGMAESAPRMNAEQAAQRATWQGRIAERMWEHLSNGDPE